MNNTVSFLPFEGVFLLLNLDHCWKSIVLTDVMSGNASQKDVHTVQYIEYFQSSRFRTQMFTELAFKKPFTKKNIYLSF